MLQSLRQRLTSNANRQSHWGCMLHVANLADICISVYWNLGLTLSAYCSNRDYQVAWRICWQHVRGSRVIWTWRMKISGTSIILHVRCKDLKLKWNLIFWLRFLCRPTSTYCKCFSVCYTGSVEALKAGANRYVKLKYQLSVEVTPTTLWLVLLIYSFNCFK